MTVDLDMRFSAEELDLLRSKKGDKLEAVGYVPITSDVAFGRVRLYFAGGSLDVVSTMHDIDYSGDGEVDDDDAFLSIGASEGDLVAKTEIDGNERRVEYGKIVQRVIVAQDSVDSYENGELTFKTIYPQAVVFDLGDELLGLDKQDCNWMMLTMKHGTVLEDLVYDSAKGWKVDPEESPELHNEFSREYLEL